MAINELQALHPRRAGIGAALARAIPMPDDRKNERKMLRRMDLAEAVRK